MRKRLIAISCVIAMLCGGVGCSKSGKFDKVKELNVLTEESFIHEVDIMARFARDMDSSININIEVLPTRKEEREAKIQKLRTEIMAGKGPDLYLMDTDTENVVDPKEPLFENPYKTMQSGAFASLDRYMKKDTYWKDSTYHDAFLKVGQHEGKQYILPLSCYYPVLIGMQGAEKIQGETLGEWMEQAEESTDVSFGELMARSDCFLGARWFEPAVDYEANEVLFDKEKWSDFASDYFEAAQKRQNINIEDQLHYNINNIALYTETEGSQFLQNIPDVEGRNMATVKGYAAIGMSSDYKQEAYDFLMLFVNAGIKNENVGESGTNALGKIDPFAISVQESTVERECGKLTLDTFRQIDGAYFITDAERALYSSVTEAIASMYEKEFDAEAGWEAVANQIAEEAWSDYKMQVSE